MIKRGILTLLAITVLAIAAGCAASNGQPGTGAAGSAAEEQTNQASPYSQPLMATGGDLVMLHWERGTIAG